jgi:hypothetical protein
MNQKNIPKTLTLPLPLAGSVSKPKLSHSVKFHQNHFHKEKTGKKESSRDMQAREKSKASDKIFTIENKKQDKNFTGTCLGLAFLRRVGQCGACIPLLYLFTVLAAGSRRIGSAAIWRSPKYIMPVIGSRNTKINTAEKQAAYNLHYVNIALGIYFWRAFLYPEGAAQLLPVMFYR